MYCLAKYRPDHFQMAMPSYNSFNFLYIITYKSVGLHVPIHHVLVHMHVLILCIYNLTAEKKKSILQMIMHKVF